MDLSCAVVTKTAAALVIGNELLTGKIRDENLSYLASELFALGVSLRRAVFCLDDVATIAADLGALREAHDIVFTSGGVGPTHDDVTLLAVARSFAVDLVRSPELEGLLRGHYGDRVSEAHLRMADVPRGAALVRGADARWPTLRVGNVYVLPGVPQAFRMKLDAVRDELRGGERFFSHAVYTQCSEADVAELLTRLAEEHADVAVGSYPRWDDPDHRLKVTFDATDPARARRAADALVADLDPALIVRRVPA